LLLGLHFAALCPTTRFVRHSRMEPDRSAIVRYSKYRATDKNRSDRRQKACATFAVVTGCERNRQAKPTIFKMWSVLCPQKEILSFPVDPLIVIASRRYSNSHLSVINTWLRSPCRVLSSRSKVPPAKRTLPTVVWALPS
jgi:hypothetical protein